MKAINIASTIIAVTVIICVILGKYNVTLGLSILNTALTFIYLFLMLCKKEIIYAFVISLITSLIGIVYCFS